MFERLAHYIDTEGMARPAFIMLVATVVGGGCNFLYQVMMANLIPDDLAELNTLLAILYIVTVPSTAVQNVIIRYVSKYKALNEDSAVAWIMKRTLVITSMAGVAIAVLLVIALSVPSVTSTLNLTSTLPVILLAVGVVASMVSPVGQGTIQAFQRFTTFGGLVVGNFTLKLTLGVGMVLFGFGVAGALGGVVIGIAFATGASLVLVRKYFFLSPTPVESREIWRFTVPATVAILGFTILTQVDVIFATSLLTSEEASYYAAASTLAKIILFLPGAVSTVMFPKISKAHAEKGETHRILKSSFLMTLVLSGVVVAVYFLAPHLVLDILLPANPYKDLIAPILQGLGVAFLLLGLANLFMLYGLATDGHAYITIIVLSVVVMVSMVGITIATGTTFTPTILVAIMILTGLFTVVLSGIYLFIVEREWRPLRSNGT
jgi:O-antigen/teichoic acid export membrane protein